MPLSDGRDQRIAVGSRFFARYLASPSATFGPHAHTAHTVTVVLAGSVAMSIGDQPAALAPGEAGLTNPGQSHAGQAHDFELVSISLDAALLDEILTEMGLYHSGAQVLFGSSTVAHPEIANLARRVADELQAELPGRGPMLDALVRQLAVHLARSALTVRRSGTIELSRAGPVDRRLRRAVEFMHDNYSRDLAMAEIARAAYLSESYFAHLFRDVAGVTPYGYLANLRIEQARSLLLTTDLAVGEIARRVGYRSQSHFARVFRAVAGVSPRKYRKSRIPPV